MPNIVDLCIGAGLNALQLGQSTKDFKIYQWLNFAHQPV